MSDLSAQVADPQPQVPIDEEVNRGRPRRRLQAQRFRIERAFQEVKSHCGMADYQARKWRSWHHYMALVAMSLLVEDCPYPIR